MGLISILAASRYRELDFSEDDTPEDVAKFVDAMFRPFGKKTITLEEITETLARTHQSHNLDRVLDGWKEFVGPALKSKEDAKKVLQGLVDNFKAAKLAQPNPPATDIPMEIVMQLVKRFDESLRLLQSTDLNDL